MLPISRTLQSSMTVLRLEYEALIPLSSFPPRQSTWSEMRSALFIGIRHSQRLPALKWGHLHGWRCHWCNTSLPAAVPKTISHITVLLPEKHFHFISHIMYALKHSTMWLLPCFPIEQEVLMIWSEVITQLREQWHAQFLSFSKVHNFDHKRWTRVCQPECDNWK